MANNLLSGLFCVFHTKFADDNIKEIMPYLGRQLYKPLHLNRKQYTMGFNGKKRDQQAHVTLTGEWTCYDSVCVYSSAAEWHWCPADNLRLMSHLYRVRLTCSWVMTNFPVWFHKVVSDFGLRLYHYWIENPASLALLLGHVRSIGC